MCPLTVGDADLRTGLAVPVVEDGDTDDAKLNDGDGEGDDWKRSNDPGGILARLETCCFVNKEGVPALCSSPGYDKLEGSI